MTNKPKYKQGDTIGSFTVVKYSHSHNRNGYYLVTCNKCNTQSTRQGLTNLKVKSCGCEINNKVVKLIAFNKTRIKYNIKDTALRDVYRTYKKSAIKRKLPFYLLENEFLSTIKKPCHYCGQEPNRIAKVSHAIKEKQGEINYFNGIDRIENNKGYVINNIVACCTKCNFLKNNYSEKEFLTQIEKIYLYKIKK
jgi:hypothetical protein